MHVDCGHIVYTVAASDLTLYNAWLYTTFASDFLNSNSCRPFLSTFFGMKKLKTTFILVATVMRILFQSYGLQYIYCVIISQYTKY